LRTPEADLDPRVQTATMKYWDPVIFLLSIATALLSALLTFAMRRIALARRLVDVPNERSSHNRPTPRGGGVAIVLSATAAFGFLAARGSLGIDLFMALFGGLAVAAIGVADDRRPLPVRIRLVVHFGAAIWALAWLGGFPPLRVGNEILRLAASGYVLGVLGIVWVINLFNFMDGIDGIATSEATFVVWSAALVPSVVGVSGGMASAELTFGAACFGFLLWNWPPARIFMGDVGSSYLGYVIGALALAAARDNPVALWVWLILGSVFFVDATVTLARRVIRGDRVYQAHRTHAYQWLARRWGSHRRVTVAVLLANVFWLLPCAVFATLHPSLAAVTTLVALAPLLAIAITAGSGRPEQPDRARS
jgi:glycosyltransferase WbpL